VVSKMKRSLLIVILGVFLTPGLCSSFPGSDARAEDIWMRITNVKVSPNVMEGGSANVTLTVEWSGFNRLSTGQLPNGGSTISPVPKLPYVFRIGINEGSKADYNHPVTSTEDKISEDAGMREYDFTLKVPESAGAWQLVAHIQLMLDLGGGAYAGVSIHEKIFTIQISKKDSDRDGLSDEEESLYGTNANKPDTDGDGISDSEEVRITKTDPLKKDTDGDKLPDRTEIINTRTDPTKADTDGDGLNDGEEMDIGSNPLSRDTDDDGLDDKKEADAKTDPAKADTDGDGLKDGDEILRGTDPTKADTDDDGLNDSEETEKYNTNPEKADTDEDGLSDKEEIEKGTNPLMKDTDGDLWGDAIDPMPVSALVPDAILLVVVAFVVGFVARRKMVKA